MFLHRRHEILGQERIEFLHPGILVGGEELALFPQDRPQNLGIPAGTGSEFQDRHIILEAAKFHGRQGISIVIARAVLGASVRHVERRFELGRDGIITAMSNRSETRAEPQEPGRENQ